MKSISYILSLFFIIFFTQIFSCTSGNEIQDKNTRLNDNAGSIRFAVMPFLEHHDYQYDYDIIQEALLIALRTKGYYIVDHLATIDSITQELNFNLTNLNDQQAKKIADYLNIHIIIFGRVEFNHDRPIVIKALDAYNNKVILRERLDSRTDWGLYHANKDIRTMTKDYIDKLMLIYSQSDIN